MTKNKDAESFSKMMNIGLTISILGLIVVLLMNGKIMIPLISTIIFGLIKINS